MVVYIFEKLPMYNQNLFFKQELEIDVKIGYPVIFY